MLRPWRLRQPRNWHHEALAGTRSSGACSRRGRACPGRPASLSGGCSRPSWTTPPPTLTPRVTSARCSASSSTRCTQAAKAAFRARSAVEENPPMAVERALERRIVSVLFADLVGFTSLSEQLDAEDVVTVQGAYFATVRETVERYGGSLEKFIGDAAMAVFGVPRSRDDDAERAVRAGLALIGGIQQIGARLGLDETALRLRVGVNT